MNTQDLFDKRDELKQQIYDDFVDTFPEEDGVYDFDDILFGEEKFSEWKEKWEEERQTIGDIDVIEQEIGNEDEYMIPESEWVDYVKELCQDVGYISKDFPWWIRIDWEATADEVATDYTPIEWEGRTYYVRNC